MDKNCIFGPAAWVQFMFGKTCLASSFWATVCKKVRLIGPLSVSHVTLVYCGQAVGWIEMKLGMVADLPHVC